MIKEEEFYIILEKSSELKNLRLLMGSSQITDKFFYGMQFNEKLKALIELDLRKSFLISDEGFVQFVRSGIPENLRILNLS